MQRIVFVLKLLRISKSLLNNGSLYASSIFMVYHVLTTYPTIPACLGIQIGSTPFAALDHRVPFNSSSMKIEAHSQLINSQISSTSL